MPPKSIIDPFLDAAQNNNWGKLVDLASNPENHAAIKESSGATLAILYAAIKYSDNVMSTTAAILLLEAGASANGAVDDSGQSALHWAILNANRELALALVQRHPHLLAKTNADRLTPIHLATRSISSERYTSPEKKAAARRIITDIVTAHSETEPLTFQYSEALFVVTKNAEFTVATALLKAGAAITIYSHAAETMHWSVLDFALAWYETYFRTLTNEETAPCQALITMLLEKQAPTERPISEALIHSSNWFLLNTYLEMLNDQNKPLKLSIIGPWLSRALIAEQHRTKSLLITMYDKIAQRIATEKEDMFRWEDQPCGPKNWSLAHFAANTGDLACVEFLLRSQVNFFDPASAKQQPVSLAKAQGHMNILAAVFTHFPCKQTYETCFRDKEYDIAIFAQNKPELMFLLLANGLDLAKKNKHEQTVESLLLTNDYAAYLFPVLYNIFSSYRTRTDAKDQQKTKEQFDDFKALCAAIDLDSGIINTDKYRPTRFMHSIVMLRFFHAGTKLPTHYTIFRDKIIELSPENRIIFLRNFVTGLQQFLKENPYDTLAPDMLAALTPVVMVALSEDPPPAYAQIPVADQPQQAAAAEDNDCHQDSASSAPDNYYPAATATVSAFQPAFYQDPPAINPFQEMYTCLVEVLAKKALDRPPYITSTFFRALRNAQNSIKMDEAADQPGSSIPEQKFFALKHRINATDSDQQKAWFTEFQQNFRQTMAAGFKYNENLSIALGCPSSDGPPTQQRPG